MRTFFSRSRKRGHAQTLATAHSSNNQSDEARDRTGFVGRQRVDEVLDLTATALMILQQFVVFAVGFEVQGSQSASQPGLDQFTFPIAQRDPRELINELTELVKIVIFQFDVSVGIHEQAAFPMAGD